jgi:hypothetical protein
MTSPTITPKHRAIVKYYKDREQLTTQEVTHEMAVRESFKALLASVANLNQWTLVVERVVAVSVQTVDLIAALPVLDFGEQATHE